MRIDLLDGKKWSPKETMARWYFGENYVQVNISNGSAYYKLVGFEGELENADEVLSQLSYFTGVSCRRIYLSKF